MPSPDRRAAGRRRAWGRGPCTLKLESLERRALLTASSTSPLPDLVNSALSLSSTAADWGSQVEVMGKLTNQGGAATASDVQVEIYASPVRGINKYAVPIGSVTVPAGLAPGQSIPYQTSVSLPTSPVPDVPSNGGTLYLTTAVNPGKVVPEDNYHNDRDLGPPYDAVPMVIQPAAASELVGTTLAVNTPTTTWGSTVQVTAQITNQGAGTSPQTTAVLSLTPQGLNYGNSTTVGVGTITVPPLGPYQTYNTVVNVTLPAVEPLAIANYTNFGLTMTQDGNYVTNQLYPNAPAQGIGYDQTAMTITTSTTSTATTGSLPDLAASSIMAPNSTVRWGDSFSVTTDIQNIGQGAAGPFPVFFVLTGQSGSITDAIYLGQTTISGLNPGQTQQVNQTLTLPTRLPNGVTLGSVGYGRIAVILDPNNTVNETLRSNNESISAPFIVRLPGNASIVPTQAAAGALPTVANVAQRAQTAAKKAAAAKRAARAQAPHPSRQRKLHRHAPPKTNGIVNKGVSLATELTKLPHQIESVIKTSL
jgi:subtilase family serine protease